MLKTFRRRFAFEAQAQGLALRFLDVEGSGENSEMHSTRLYVAALLVSHVAILNLPGHLGKSAFLDKVASLCVAAQKVGGKSALTCLWLEGLDTNQTCLPLLL